MIWLVIFGLLNIFNKTNCFYKNLLTYLLIRDDYLLYHLQMQFYLVFFYILQMLDSVLSFFNIRGNLILL